MSKRDLRSDDPLWYKDAVIYELRVRSFFDSDGDGIGDFEGLCEKLDYLEDLGVTALWLLPFYPSPLRDDGYDISDYTAVHPDCGTMADFKRLLREAHARGMRVITELVLNHSSDQHPWFQRARRAPARSRWRDFYIWSDDPSRYAEARIIFQDFEPSNWTWDPVAKAYYWHRFYAHQPDLNYDNPEVRRAMFAVVDFWLKLGVDGLRLDAVPYLFEREGTSCENLPETHTLLRELRAHVDERFPNRMLLAEANQWPEDAVAYLAGGQECHMAFHFPLMPRLFLAVRLEDRFPITDIWAQTPPLHESCQWAIFLRNHDELTLEMVTDEERDAMYRAYAQELRMRVNLGIRRRLAPLLGGHRRAIELLNALLLSLPGTPVLYYGDEIGMGDNIYLGDRNGVRTPMQWSDDKNAGFSRASPQQLILPVVVDAEYHYAAVNVETQQRNQHSLLWWTKRLLALRKQHRAFGRGTLELLSPDNPRVLAFVREHETERILVVANLSRFVQHVRLDLARWRGCVPVELFGGSDFPRVSDRPYALTLGPHSFYWFALRDEQRGAGSAGEGEAAPRRELGGQLAGLLAREEGRELLVELLPAYLRRQRWFGGKARTIQEIAIADVVPLPGSDVERWFCLARVAYREGEPETYLLPLGVAQGAGAEDVGQRWPRAVLAELVLRRSADRALLFDAGRDERFWSALLDFWGARRRARGELGQVHAAQVRGQLARETLAGLAPRVLSAEQSNTSVVFGEQLMLKLYRKLGEGTSPEVEIGRHLAGRYASAPALAGWLEHAEHDGAEPLTLGVLHRFVPSQGDAWEHTLRQLRHFIEHALAEHRRPPAVRRGSLVRPLDAEPPELVRALIGGYLAAARLLGQRVAELHLVLAAATEDPALRAERYSALHQRAAYQSLRNLSGRALRTLRRSLGALPEEHRATARRVLGAERRIARVFDGFLRAPITALRIRCHGDLHLGQVLFTGADFAIIDFEGEPAAQAGDRRRKHTGLRDVAGMLRSFHYAAAAALSEARERGGIGRQAEQAIEAWVRLWQAWSSQSFLRGYLATAEGSPILPASREELVRLLGALMLEKAIYELGYELNTRPAFVGIPLAGIAQILDELAAPR